MRTITFQIQATLPFKPTRPSCTWHWHTTKKCIRLPARLRSSRQLKVGYAKDSLHIARRTRTAHFPNVPNPRCETNGRGVRIAISHQSVTLLMSSLPSSPPLIFIDPLDNEWWFSPVPLSLPLFIIISRVQNFLTVAAENREDSRTP